MSLTPTKAQQDAERDRAFADLRERVDALVDEAERGRKHAAQICAELRVGNTERNELRAQRNAALSRVRELEADGLFVTLQEIGNGWRDRATHAERLAVELGQLAARPHTQSCSREMAHAPTGGPTGTRDRAEPKCQCGASEHNQMVQSLVRQLPALATATILPSCKACLQDKHNQCSGWCGCHLTGCPGGAA